jgi:cytochrome c oxidase subunit I+III
LVGGAAWSLDLATWRGTGLAPDLDAQGAIVHAMQAWQGFFVAIGAIMAVYVVLRWLFGYVGPERPATVQLVGLFQAYVAAQGLVTLAVPRLFAAIPA